MLFIRNMDVIQSYLAILEQKLYLTIPTNSKMSDREPQSTCRSLHVQIPHMFVQLSSCILSHRIIFSNTLPRTLYTALYTTKTGTFCTGKCYSVHYLQIELVIPCTFLYLNIKLIQFSIISDTRITMTHGRAIRMFIYN